MCFKIVLYMNCHANEIQHYMHLHDKFKDSKFTIMSSYGSINRAKTIGDGGDLIVFNEYKSVIEECDIFIYNPISELQGFWYYKNILKYLKNDVITIKIPYYRSGIYLYGSQDGKTHGGIKPCNNLFRIGLSGILIKFFFANNEHNMEMFVQLMNNITEERKEYIKKKVDGDLQLFKELNEQKSDINMFDFFQNNYTKYQLFLNYDHPSSFFFKELVQRMLDIFFNIKVDFPINNINLLGTHSQPIVDVIKMELNLTFNTDDMQFQDIILKRDDYIRLYYLMNYNDKYIHSEDYKSILDENNIIYTLL